MKKRMLALALALVVAISTCACGGAASNEEATTEEVNQDNAEESAEQESEYPEYLNLDSPWPVIKDEHAGEITLKVAMVVDPESGEWDDLWVSRYLKDKYNIELEMEYIPQSALEEKKSLMMNSGELPDIMLNMLFTTDELVKYGSVEGLFLPVEDYINETLTPGLMNYWTDAVAATCTANDGHIYSLPRILDIVHTVDYYGRTFMNKKWLDELGLEMPRTLDEFVDTLYTIKEADPSGVGSENLYPFGGDMENVSNTWYLLNAFGYNQTQPIFTTTTGSSYGLEPCLRDGEVVIPAYDTEVYQEFLKLMNQFYNDGIINPNFFTIDSVEINAQMIEGKNALYYTSPYTSGITTWNEWESCYPLTSEWQDTPETFTPESATVGNFVISADTEYPELCMRFADVFFNNETDTAGAFWGGTGEGSEYDYEGYQLLEWLEEKSEFTMDLTKLPEGYNTSAYLREFVNGILPKFGACNLREGKAATMRQMGLDVEYPIDPVYDETNPDNHFRISVTSNVVPYASETYPKTYYASEEDSQKIIDLTAVIEPYAKEQIALFITGERPISEIEAFKAELQGLGMDELLSIYTDIYNTSIQN